MKRTYLLILFILIIIQAYTQNSNRSVTAVRVLSPPKIDGKLDEELWINVPVANDFTQVEPFNGEPSRKRTEVRVVYDNTAIYVGAMMYDDEPDKILKELGRRDIGENNADIFGVFFDTYNDDINAFAFTVSASGVQSDIKFSANGTAFVWDAVWQSKVSIVENGWVAELKIPYSAIRFSDQLEQTWGLNFIRIIRRYREKSSWNLFDLSIDGFVNQFGELNGIKDIKSPIRLSVMPYLSSYLEHYPFNIKGTSNYSYSFNGGMDLKYGLSESFTLDVTIVPDFGQVRSDNEVLNLSPFEVRYDENRQFFTEGTELFNKGGLFYSRRIGGKPSGYYTLSDQLNEGEKIVNNPDESQLINASKISGRTLNGLGIGIFNAMTANTYATIEDSLGNTRITLTEPFTNYNIMVFDQSLKNKSYVSLINTNVSRHQGTRNANVTGTKFKIRDKSNTYAIKGFGAVSNVHTKTDNNGTGASSLGYKYNAEFGKISGNFQFELEQNVESDTYDPNDLGFLYNNNEISNVIRFRYNIYKPFWKLLKLYSFIGTDYNTLYKPRNFTEYGIFGMVNTTTLKYLSGGVSFRAIPVESYDYFESRVDGRYFIRPKKFNVNGWISTDYRKKMALDINFYIKKANKYDHKVFRIGINPRIRINDKLSFVYRFKVNNDYNNIGFATIDTSANIIFGKRNIQTINNTISGNYIFTNKIALGLRVRHYWSQAKYDQFYFLQDDGYLGYTDYSADHNINFNAFNIDVVYTWEFAPGSEMKIVWKNAILRTQNELIDNFYRNLENTWDSPQANSVSIKLLYYLDYLYFKKTT